MRFTDVMLDRGLQALREGAGVSCATARATSSGMPDVVPRELIVLSSDDDSDDSDQDGLSCSDDDDDDDYDDLGASEDGECESDDETVNSESCLMTSDDDVDEDEDQDSDDYDESVDTPAESAAEGVVGEEEEEAEADSAACCSGDVEPSRVANRGPRSKPSDLRPEKRQRRSGGTAIAAESPPPPSSVPVSLSATLDDLPLRELVSRSYEFVQTESVHLRQYHAALQYRIWRTAEDVLLKNNSWSSSTHDLCTAMLHSETAKIVQPPCFVKGGGTSCLSVIRRSAPVKAFDVSRCDAVVIDLFLNIGAVIAESVERRARSLDQDVATSSSLQALSGDMHREHVESCKRFTADESASGVRLRPSKPVFIRSRDTVPYTFYLPDGSTRSVRAPRVVRFVIHRDQLDTIASMQTFLTFAVEERRMSAASKPVGVVCDLFERSMDAFVREFSCKGD